MKPTYLRSCLLLCLALVCLPGQAFSQTDEEKIAEAVAWEAGKAAVKELGYESGKRLVDLGFQSAPPPNGEQSVGSQTVAWVRLGLAVKDFAEADTDKGKAFAAADVGVATLMIAFPPAGVVAAIAVFAVKIVDMKLSHDHAKRMMEIMKRTQEHYEQILLIFRQRAKADYLEFMHLQKGLEAEFEAISNLNEDLKTECSELMLGRLDLERLESCHSLTMKIFPRVMNYISLADRLLSFRSNYISMEKVFADQDKDLNALKERISGLKEEFLVLQAAAKSSFKEIGKFIALAAIRQAQSTGNVSAVVRLRSECFHSSTRLARKINLAILSKELGSKNSRQKLVEAYSESVLSFDSACTELIVTDSDPLLPQLIIFRQSLAKAEGLLSEPVSQERLQ